MKAAVFTAPNTIEYCSNYQDPILGDGLILNIRATGVCATDIKALAGNRPGMEPPRILGHELAGDILESVMPEFQPGERLSVAPYAGCGKCKFCLEDREDLCRSKVFLSDGAFAEKVAIPKLLAQKTAWRIPEAITYKEAALAEPLACVVFSMRACRWEPGWSMLVIGGGFMGLLHVLLASAWGAAHVLLSEPNPTRRALAEKLGAVTFDPSASGDLAQWATEQTDGNGPNVLITAVGNLEVIESVINATRPGGVVHFFGGLPKDKNLTISSYLIHYKSVSLIGTSGFRTRDYKLASEMIATKTIDLNPLISACLPLRDANEALRKAKQAEFIKVVLCQD